MGFVLSGKLVSPGVCGLVVRSFTAVRMDLAELESEPMSLILPILMAVGFFVVLCGVAVLMVVSWIGEKEEPLE